MSNCTVDAPPPTNGENKTTQKGNNNNGKDEEQLNSTEADNDDATIMSAMTNTKETNSRREQKENNNNETTTKQSAVGEKKVENPYTKRATPTKPSSMNNNTKEDYASITQKSIKNKTKVSQNNHNQIRTNQNNAIRIRFSFVGQENGQSKKNNIKQILYDTMRCAKALDSRSALMTWRDEDDLSNLNGDEARMIPDQMIRKYVDMPPVEGNFIAGEVYYGNGVRIQTCMKVNEFVEKWNNRKYDSIKNSPFKNWKPIRRAEMQQYPVSYPIGYLAGTTERGYYDTVVKSLMEEFEDKIELSFQSIYQPGVSTRVWKLARETADRQYLNNDSRNHKMIKFSMAPSALTIYVGDEKLTKRIRTKFIDKYGRNEDEQWPEMADHSRMRFIPIVKGYINDGEAREKLYRHLKHQAVSKAGEVKLNFPYHNINTKQRYLCDKSLEQIIHGMTTKSDKEIPVFKHITTKWVQKEGETQQYEVAVASSLVNEATSILRGLNNHLIKEYGNNVRNHFAGAKMENTTNVVPRKRNFTLFNTDWDDDISNFIKQSDNTDKLSKVLIEGMEMITNPQGVNDNKGAIIFNEPVKEDSEGKHDSKKKENEKNDNGDKTSKEKTTEKEVIVIDDELGTQQESITNTDEANKGDEYLNTKEWDDIAFGSEYEKCILATSDEKRKTLNTLERYNIDIHMIEQWKNANWDKMEQLLKECKWKEYSSMKRMVEDIRKTQENKNISTKQKASGNGENEREMSKTANKTQRQDSEIEKKRQTTK